MTSKRCKESHRPCAGWRRAILALLALSLALVQGCWGKRELEDRSFVTLMGVDLAEDGDLLVTVVIAVPRAMGGGKMGGGGGGSAASAIVLSGEGRDMTQALNRIELLNSRELSTMHMTFLLLGQEFASTDIGPVIDLFSRSLEFRHNTMVAVCSERAVDFLRGFQVIEETEPSEYLRKTISTSYSTMSVCPQVTMHDIMVAYNALSVDPWAPYVGLASASAAESTQGALEKKGGKGEGGGESRLSSAEQPGKVIKILGTAVFRKVGDVQRMVGYLDTEESAAALLMQGSFTSAYLTIAFPGDQSETTLFLHNQSSSSKVAIRDGTPLVRFEIRLNASLEESRVTTVPQPEFNQAFRQALVFTVQDQMYVLLDRTFRKLASLGTDVLAVGRKAQGGFSTEEEWENFDWPERFKTAQARFDIKIHLPTEGFTIEKPYPR